MRDHSDRGTTNLIDIVAPGHLEVRCAQRADLARLGRLGARLLEEHYAYDPQRFLASWTGVPTDYAEFLSAQLANPAALVLVAHIDGDVIGYVYAVATIGHATAAERCGANLPDNPPARWC